ncbi:HU family DNA-binding protein [Salipiger mucosus]|uniref:Non-specific DNA-binding protein n=1 Tax=Salipiger mucosus DSM 16094 TaxID=1123237 RepID=S9QVE5_9RHOB|nr:HU family DNA-binding protein [Salipiger mucosus]EPX83532.1 non-specific DNA-binding protein [Salipiger mucosus DSM 16094]
MNKVEIEAKVAEELGMTRKDVSRVMSAVTETIGDAIGKGQDVRISKFGSFRVTTRKACKSKDPTTGEIRMIPESKRIMFRPGKDLKSKVRDD